MPAFVITRGAAKTDQTTIATLCDPNINGEPDRASAVPVEIRRVNEKVLCVDGENRGIISCTGRDGTMTFLLDGGGSKRLRNHERRFSLSRALGQLQQPIAALRQLIAASADPEPAKEGLGLLLCWCAAERERLTAAPSYRRRR